MLTKEYYKQCPYVWLQAWAELLEALMTIVTLGIVRTQRLSWRIMLWRIRKEHDNV